MAEVEVKATVSFGQYRFGQYYRADTDDAGIQGLIFSGYLVVTKVFAPAPAPKKPRRKVSRGNSGDLPAGGEFVQPEGDETFGGQDSAPDS